MCDKQECKCGNVPVVGKTYQHKGEPGFHISVLYVGMQKVMALVLSRGIVARAVGEEISLPIRNFGDGSWKEYVPPKVEVKDFWIKNVSDEEIIISVKREGVLSSTKVLGRIRVTVTNDELTSVEMFKGN